ncbi:hypothetical protein QDZ74_000167 [Pluralibacter gergoviae]|nr:hypothetical protein [Pluralibacter gergoviae]EKT9641005.1 hypothetical protein [Pluralibacter gergoviae]EKW6616617.1 hypothetical protein [Pluralibacter gergoviae]ELD4301301.1 hypothetical protein [Pluralibacter gergoviae]EMD1656377.1 hypothetical protein [Pluralibacter gergoviae]
MYQITESGAVAGRLSDKVHKKAACSVRQMFVNDEVRECPAANGFSA